jgi:hypothetical protein
MKKFVEQKVALSSSTSRSRNVIEDNTPPFTDGCKYIGRVFEERWPLLDLR